jgi:hypothetical protein
MRLLTTKPGRRTTRMLRSAATLAAVSSVAAAAVVATPAANAQSLNSVAITTSVSGAFLALDVSGGSTSPGAGVIQWYGHFGANQRWNFVQTANGNEQIVNQNSGMCLTTSGVAGQQLYQWYCNGSPRQEWSGTLQPKLGDGFAVGGRALINPASGLAADIEGGNGWAGARLIGWYPNGGDNQQFKYYQLF